MSDNRYKCVYTSGKEFVVVSTMDSTEFVRIEKKSAGKDLEKVYKASQKSEDTGDDWELVYPQAVNYYSGY